MIDRPLVIYHANCADGFTAAWAVRRHFMQRCGVEPELLAAKYGDVPPDVSGRDVVIVDFSYPRDVLIEMSRRVRSIVVLDHHRTAAADLAGLDFAVFDMERSGAGLAWDWFFAEGPSVTAPEPRPWLIDYVEDRDLWRWKLPHSREINAALATYDFTVEQWDLLGESAHEDPRQHSWPPDALVDMGDGILRYQAREVAKHVERARPASLWVSADLAHIVPVVNATTLISEIGNELARTYPFAVMWFQREDGRFVYSLRSSAENPEHADVSEIARALGGGGHKHAAGFTSDAPVHEVVS